MQGAKAGVDSLTSRNPATGSRGQSPFWLCCGISAQGRIVATSTSPADFLLTISRSQPTSSAPPREVASRNFFLGSSCIYPKFAEQPIKENRLLEGPLEPTDDQRGEFRCRTDPVIVKVDKRYFRPLRSMLFGVTHTRRDKNWAGIPRRPSPT
jgi:hypothetical protein